MVSAGASLWALLGQLYTIAGPCLMLVYPLYQSILAIESPGKEDDAQWLTYWVIFYTFVELGFERLLSWMPMWYTVKLIAVAWLVLPPFRGAAFIYDTYVKKYAGTLTTVKVQRQLNSEQRSILSQMSPGARNTVAQYINENGTHAFDKIVRSALNDFKKSRSPTGESGRHRWSSDKHARSPTGESGRHRWSSDKHARSPTEESGRHWWSSDKHAREHKHWWSSDKYERSPESGHEKGEKKHFWSHHFDDNNSDRRHGGWSPESKEYNWGWDHHFDGGM